MAIDVLELHLASAMQRLQAELTFKLRPRERAPLEVAATVGADRHGLRWVIRPASTAHPPPS